MFSLLLQTIFTRLYKTGSSMEGGTLLNLVNRQNISGDISGKFNAAIDFFELVVTGHILAAAMHFFGLSSREECPTQNAISLTNVSCDWLTLKHAVERIVDNYVMVNHELITNPELHQAS